MLFNLFLLICFAAGITLVIAALTFALGKVFDSPYWIRAWDQVLVGMCMPVAIVATRLERGLVWLHRRAYMNDSPYADGFLSLAERFDVAHSHLLSRAIGQVDYACQDMAERGAWDWAIGCGNHRCGMCEECTIDGLVRSPYSLSVRAEARLRRWLTLALCYSTAYLPNRVEPLVLRVVAKVDPAQDHRFAHAADVLCLECMDAYDDVVAPAHEVTLSVANEDVATRMREINADGGTVTASYPGVRHTTLHVSR